MPSFPKYNVVRIDETNTNIKLNQNLDSINKVLGVLTSQPNKVQLTNIALSMGLNTIPHTLDKVLTGWTVTDNSGAANVWSSQKNASIATLPSIYLYLNASAACTVDLEVW